ncbi:general secretion pathway protein GspB [Ramlibacter paludis]|uniref:general secretion pathway protein GspB n=1 Tax=Ramlibacter paludis TaxID=2908000 RepID=UPI0023DB5183|nr:general secretion pathway protein GspB [Ramlibacter paludis]
MSYILDALRKADAERERDPARGIHAQPMAAQPAPQRASYAPWAAVALVAAALAGYAWSQRSPAPSSLRLPVAAPSDPMPAVAPPKVMTVATAVQPAPPPMPEPVKVPVVAKAVIKAPADAKPVAAEAKPAAAAPERIYAQTELPQDVQQALPKLAISGGVFSDNVAQRMLVVGGQVVSEGKELAPGLVLDQIGPRNAVLRFRGYKYSVIY